jgi:hypothetical protein
VVFGGKNCEYHIQENEIYGVNMGFYLSYILIYNEEDMTLVYPLSKLICKNNTLIG